jgi:hypothetical protein
MRLPVNHTNDGKTNVFDGTAWPAGHNAHPALERKDIMTARTARLSKFAKENWKLLAGFLVAVIIALWFATRFVMDFLYFQDPSNVDVDLEPWMTPRFIVMTYDLPRPLVFDLLGIQQGEQRGQPLRDVAEDLGLTMDELTDLVRDAAQKYREAQP